MNEQHSGCRGGSWPATTTGDLVWTAAASSVGAHVVLMWRGHLLLGTVNQLVLVGALIAGADALVLPQSLGVLVEFLQGTREAVRGGACTRAAAELGVQGMKGDTSPGFFSRRLLV